MNYKPDMLTTFQNDKNLKMFCCIQCSIFTLFYICSEESNSDNVITCFPYKITHQSTPPRRLSFPVYAKWNLSSCPGVLSSCPGVLVSCPPPVCARSVPGLGVKSSSLSQSESVSQSVSSETATDLLGEPECPECPQAPTGTGPQR